ncbi:hypothetical protein PI124_g19754 [Phytophthora idaei]|nr:hypothetical protein PI124_g19754 [Phytophthora idaei]
MSCFEHGAGRSGSCQHATKEGGKSLLKRDWCVLKLLQPNKTPRNKLYVYYNSYAFAFSLNNVCTRLMAAEYPTRLQEGVRYFGGGRSRVFCLLE